MRSSYRDALVFAFAAIVLAAAPASSEEQHASPPHGYGLRAGFGLQPDQFVVGLQTLLGHRLKPFRLAPSLDLGFGDDVTTYTLNGDLEIHLRLPHSRSFAYLGGGLGITHWDFQVVDPDTDLGLNLYAGTRLSTRGRMNYNIEARLGVGDVPEFRLFMGLLLGSGAPPEG